MADRVSLWVSLRNRHPLSLSGRGVSSCHRLVGLWSVCLLVRRSRPKGRGGLVKGAGGPGVLGLVGVCSGSLFRACGGPHLC